MRWRKMNKIRKFLNSIYLGDRYCEKIDIRDDKMYIQNIFLVQIYFLMMKFMKYV